VSTTPGPIDRAPEADAQELDAAYRQRFTAEMAVLQTEGGQMQDYFALISRPPTTETQASAALATTAIG